MKIIAYLHRKCKKTYTCIIIYKNFGAFANIIFCLNSIVYEHKKEKIWNEVEDGADFLQTEGWLGR